MDIRFFGNTGLRVSALGFGAGQIGNADLKETDAEKLLKTAVESGITLFDTARGYGLSEERIGKYLSSYRDKIVISTKVGYGVSGVPDWSYECVLQGINEACAKMQTDYIDIVHLHSCPKDILWHNGVIDALEKAKSDMKVLTIGYAGENDDLNAAIESNRLGSVLASINIFDQRIISYELPKAKSKGMGVIAKRPLANAPWRFTECPTGQYCEPYWHRMKTMNLDLGMNIEEAALRFTAFTFGVDSCIVGTTNISHLKKNIEMLSKGKLDDQIIKQIHDAFHRHDQNWIGQL